VAVLVDLGALQDSAHRQGGEVSFRRLLAGLIGDRPLIRALCYLDEDAESGPGPVKASGFEAHGTAGADDTAMAMAVDAMALAPRVDCVILAPGGRRQRRLAGALLAQGVRVETASFDSSEPLDSPHHRLGRECMFVP